jgi:hypothetical protein
MRDTTTALVERMIPFGSLAISELRPMALRPGLATGLPLSRNSA